MNNQHKTKNEISEANENESHPPLEPSPGVAIFVSKSEAQKIIFL